jgi:hypothetical protein
MHEIIKRRIPSYDASTLLERSIGQKRSNREEQQEVLVRCSRASTRPLRNPLSIGKREPSIIDEHKHLGFALMDLNQKKAMTNWRMCDRGAKTVAARIEEV